jgi:hypothetical protein
MDISKLTALAGMPSSMSEALKQSIDFQRHLSDAMKPAFGFNHKFEELTKLTSSSALLASQFGAASQFAKEIDEQSRHLKTLTGPLSLFRGSMLFSDQVAKAMASSLERHNAARELAMSFSTAASALRMSDEISKQMMGISSLHLERFAEITKPYQGLLDSMNFDSYAAKTARDMASHHFWEKQYQLLVIDSAAASTIAAIWGREGIEKQLKSFGVDFQQLLDEIETTQEQPQNALQFKFPPVDFWTGFSILLAILMFIYQVRDSAQMEDRLVSEIRLSRDEAPKGTQLIEQLLQALIETKQPNENGETQFVVRARVATIRTSPSAGSTVVAEIFPNQVVTLIDQEGKWIEVSYFDWLKQEVRTGWVLKKYLVRVPTGWSFKHEVGDE